MIFNISFNQNPSISQREIEILQLVSMGYNSKEIGNKLFISEFTVQTHRKNMVKRLGFRNSYQVIVWAFKEKIFAFN